MANQQGDKSQPGQILNLNIDEQGEDARGNSPYRAGSSTTNDIVSKAKETASGTYDAVSSKAAEKIEYRKGELSSGLRTLADSFHRTGTELRSSADQAPLVNTAARYSGVAARQMERIANYFERKDLRAMTRDVENFARRNPAIFLGAAFGIGILAARFLKSSTPDRRTTRNINTNMPTAVPSSDRPETVVPPSSQRR